MATSPTRNPIQPRPASLPEDRNHKLGPGTRRSAASLTGPNVQAPRINTAAQSARSNSAEHSSGSASGKGDNVRSIARDSVALPWAYSDEDVAPMGTSAP